MKPKKIKMDSRIDFQIKALDDATGVIEGYGSVFGVQDSWNHIIEPGAYDATLADFKAKGKMPKLLWQHDTTQPIGVWESIITDERGLLLRGRLFVGEVAKAAEAYALLKGQAIDGLSIGWSPVKDRVVDGVLHIDELKLWEVSLVTFPANEEATITGVKNGGMPIREFEAKLRDEFGFSWAEAKRLSRHAYAETDEDSLRDEAIASIKQFGQYLLAASETIKNLKE